MFEEITLSYSLLSLFIFICVYFFFPSLSSLRFFFVFLLTAGSWYPRWTFWLQNDNLFRTGSLAPPVHCFGYSGLLWRLGYWLGSTDVITQCLWRRSGWPHLETFSLPISPTLLFISSPPPNPILVYYCCLLTCPYNPNLRDQIRNTNTKRSAG